MRTNDRTRQRCRGTARRITAITAVTADHGGHGRPRQSRSVTAVTDGHGRTVNVSDVGPRTPHSRTILPVWHDPYGTDRTAGTRPRRRLGGSRRGRGHGGHGKHCRSRLSRPPKAERSSAGHDPDAKVITARKRRRGHSPLWRCRCRSRRVTARTARHGGHGRSRRARLEPWGLSPPGARGRADLPGERAAAGGRGHHIPKGGRAGKENRFDSITCCPAVDLTTNRTKERQLPFEES